MFDKWNKILRPLTYLTAFIIAVIWAIFVHVEQYGSANLLKDVNTKILYDVPITNNLTSSNFAIKQVPSVADVELSGTKFELDKIESGNNFQLYIPNQKLNLGKNTIEIKVKNFSNTVQVTVLNKFVSIDVTQLQTISVSAYEHYINQNLADMSKVSKVSQSKPEVRFTGANDAINKIASAELIIDASKLVTGKNNVSPTIVPIDNLGNKVNGVETLDKITTVIEVKK